MENLAQKKSKLEALERASLDQVAARHLRRMKRSLRHAYDDVDPRTGEVPLDGWMGERIFTTLPRDGLPMFRRRSPVAESGVGWRTTCVRWT
jgi:hypothetical protein